MPQPRRAGCVGRPGYAKRIERRPGQASETLTDVFGGGLSNLPQLRMSVGEGGWTLLCCSLCLGRAAARKTHMGKTLQYPIVFRLPSCRRSGAVVSRLQVIRTLRCA